MELGKAGYLATAKTLTPLVGDLRPKFAIILLLELDTKLIGLTESNVTLLLDLIIWVKIWMTEFRCFEVGFLDFVKFSIL